MKKLVFVAMVGLLISGSAVVGEENIIPVCTIVETENNIENSSDDAYEPNKEFEDYVIGVVAGEMSPDFPYEALKAQAVAARTYAYRALKNNPNTDIKNIWQNYITKEDMKKRWGANYDKWYEKISSVVYDTAGEVVEYNNEPILAAFYSTSCGKTEECENVWSEDLPYLTSVESEGDIYSPYYENKVTVSKNQLVNIYGSSNIKINKITDAGYVQSVTIGNNTYSGENIRSTFSLRSTSFNIADDGNNIVFVTKGYGHGVGMSQYGACYMANNGSDYKEILSHYYKDTYITHIEDI